MANGKQFDFEKQAPLKEDKDPAALAAIDEGIRDAKAGRTISLEQVRKLLSRKTTQFSSNDHNEAIRQRSGSARRFRAQRRVL